MVFLPTQANNSPPLALFGFSDLSYSDTKKPYGLPCANSAIPILGVTSVKYQNSKTKLTFSAEDITPHGESITLKCDTQNGYYENTYAKTEYTITCKDGSWQGVSMCVRKCKFATSEFTKEYIVKGRNVSSQSTENQYEIKDFISATFPSTDIPIQKSGSDYYLNIGESVRIYCPTTHPPFTSDSTMMKYMNPSTSSFVTTCLAASTPTQNQWSVEMACYNGFKPCDNTEVTMKTGGEKICNDIGDCFNEFGGKKTDEKGKTIHGARLKLDCNNPWYFKQDYISPTCNDGKWTKKEAYCKAAFCGADNEIYNATGKREWNVGNAIIESKKVYYGQNYEFKCANSNRVGQKNGKTFKCAFDNQDRITVQQINTGDWFNRYCTSGCSVPQNTGDFLFYKFISDSENVTQVTALHGQYIYAQYDTWGWTDCEGGYEKTYCYDPTCSRRTCTKYQYGKTRQRYEILQDESFAWKDCPSGYETTHCHDVTCSKKTCGKKVTECNYEKKQQYCNNNTIAMNTSNELVTFPGWNTTCKDGNINTSLYDQEPQNVDFKTDRRIVCDGGGCR